jgi:hypothetical protein
MLCCRLVQHASGLSPALAFARKYESRRGGLGRAWGKARALAAPPLQRPRHFGKSIDRSSQPANCTRLPEVASDMGGASAVGRRVPEASSRITLAASLNVRAT